MIHVQVPWHPSAASLLLLSLVCCCIIRVGSSAIPGMEVPSTITLRAGVLHAPPFASVEERPDGSLKFDGFEPKLLERLVVFAKEDNVTLRWQLSRSPPQYGAALDLVANDCNTSVNEHDLQECQQFDAIIGDYYCNPARSVRVDFTPSWLRTTMSTIKHLDKPEGAQDFTTLTQADNAKAPVCVPDGTYLMTVVMAKFPNAEYLKCGSPEECIEWLQAGDCVLYADDELLLRYRQAEDPSLEVTREQFNTQYLVWPLSYNLPPVTSLLLKKWMYAAVSNATLDELYFEFFQKELCPVGTAGENCELPCDPNHGTSDARGVCVCESTKWTGDDCSIEVEENVNLIPHTLKLIAYIMFGINCLVILLCGAWLYWQQNSPQVRVSQPSFLLLVLLGCLISSSTIIAMAQESEGHGPVHACMLIPWLYSVGFSITFGTLFAKIRRVYLIFTSAARAQSGVSKSRKSAITFRETLSVIGIVLAVDVCILTAWTVVDPLQWEREVIAADQFGAPLESTGGCISEHWVAFAGAIAALHLLLLGVACYMCYVARDIPTKFSEGKYLSIAMISNLQIFIVGVPILIILGSDPQTSFFVRSVIIWMNDLAVVTLIFGNLMYSVHIEAGDGNEKVKAAVDQAMKKYSVVEKNKSGHFSSTYEHSTVGGGTRSVAMSRMSTNSQVVPGAMNRSDHKMRSSSNSNTSGHQAKSYNRQMAIGSIQEANDDLEDEAGQASFAHEEVTESDEEDEGELAPLPPKALDKDVLSNNRNSWGGGYLSTFSTGENAGSDGDIGDNSESSDDVMEDEPEPPKRTSLPPAKLPKQRPSHMSYAESRISRVRGKHAAIVEERRKSVRKSQLT